VKGLDCSEEEEDDDDDGWMDGSVPGFSDGIWHELNTLKYLVLEVCWSIVLTEGMDAATSPIVDRE
jgi:hypothetical protein